MQHQFLAFYQLKNYDVLSSLPPKLNTSQAAVGPLLPAKPPYDEV